MRPPTHACCQLVMWVFLHVGGQRTVSPYQKFSCVQLLWPIFSQYLCRCANWCLFYVPQTTLATPSRGFMLPKDSAEHWCCDFCTTVSADFGKPCHFLLCICSYEAEFLFLFGSNVVFVQTCLWHFRKHQFPVQFQWWKLLHVKFLFRSQMLL